MLGWLNAGTVDGTEMSHDPLAYFRKAPTTHSILYVLPALLALTLAELEAEESQPPLSDAQRERLREALDERIAKLSEQIRESPDAIHLYSARGTAYFHRGRFEESLADFDKMIELDSELSPSHWRRGIALYYAERYKESARQFEIYHTFDNIDRENGIWRYLAQVKAYGVERAREDLLKYEKDDREPFPDLYAMFAGDLEPDDVLARIRSAEIGDTERQKRFFYARLYLGLYAYTLDDPRAAEDHLRAAVANPWGQKASGGPGYMWHVARVHYNLLNAQRQTPNLH